MTPLSYHAEDTFACVRLCIGLCQAAGGFEDKLQSDYVLAKWRVGRSFLLSFWTDCVRVKSRMGWREGKLMIFSLSLQY